jgi:hypothetical protein
MIRSIQGNFRECFQAVMIPDGRTQKQGPWLGSSRLDRSARTGVQHFSMGKNVKYNRINVSSSLKTVPVDRLCHCPVEGLMGFPVLLRS